MGTSVTPSYFVSPDKVVGRMQINVELEGVTETVLSAITGAQLHIETVLESQLLTRAWDVRYFLDHTAFSSIQPNGAYQMEIPSGLLREDTPVIVTCSGTWGMAEQVLVPSTSYLVDYRKGVVYLEATSYHDKYIRVQCSSGFTSAGEDPDLEPAEAIPDWLEEAIISYVAVIFDTTQTTNRNPEAKDIYQRAGDHAMNVLSPYLRKRGFMFRPIASV